MLGASVYILACSLKNRIRVRLRRLREPRYLVGGLAAVAYLWVFLFDRPRRSRSLGPPGDRIPLPEILQAGSAVGPSLIGLPLLGLSALAWLLPARHDLLTFSQAEIDFLFPAPVRRRALVVHRLLRSQLGLLFAAVVPALLLPLGSSFARVRWTVAMWIVFVASRVYSTGVVLARARIGTAPASAGRAWLAPALVLAAAATVAVPVVGGLIARPSSGWEESAAAVGRDLSSGVAALLLWPFVTLVEPLFAATPQAFLAAMPGALLVLAVVLLWMLRADEALEEAVTQASARTDARRSREMVRYRSRLAAWTLPLIGRPEGALAWKAATRTCRAISLRAVIWLGAGLVGAVAASRLGGAMTQVGQVIGGVAVLAFGWAVLIGPQAIRMDLRDDLEYLDTLKTWPVAPAAAVRGEMIWPVLLLTLVAWLLAALALALSPVLLGDQSWGTRLVGATSAALLAPGAIALQYAIQNLFALLFPAWVPVGYQRARGLDAMGQRLLVVAGTLLASTILVVPGVLAGGLVWAVLRLMLGNLLAIVPAAATVAAALLVEVLLLTELLGPLYERLDLTGVERSE